jgi:hypothetical protein
VHPRTNTIEQVEVLKGQDKSKYIFLIISYSNSNDFFKLLGKRLGALCRKYPGPFV